ncbi:MAG TPA: hypothetical protein VGI95_14820 [Caulobacteraceae bacterium]|jgi:hypothetical protein
MRLMMLAAIAALGLSSGAAIAAPHTTIGPSAAHKPCGHAKHGHCSQHRLRYYPGHWHRG